MAYGDYNQQGEGEEGERGFIGDVGKRIFGKKPQAGQPVSLSQSVLQLTPITDSSRALQARSPAACRSCSISFRMPSTRLAPKSSSRSPANPLASRLSTATVLPPPVLTPAIDSLASLQNASAMISSGMWMAADTFGPSRWLWSKRENQSGYWIVRSTAPLYNHGKWQLRSDRVALSRALSEKTPVQERTVPPRPHAPSCCSARRQGQHHDLQRGKDICLINA
jgi:hypothetical protein